MAGEAERVLEGDFSVFAMVHTMDFGGPDGRVDPAPWDGSRGARGPFTYASKPCNGDAPVNNVATDLPALGGAVPGSRVPASVRSHPLRFEVTQAGDVTALRGTISLTVCQLRSGSTGDDDPVPDHAKPHIEIGWSGQVSRLGPELVTWRGSFTILGGTGRYARLRGDGDIAGYFFCFDPQGCAPHGVLQDGQYAMIGRYRIPEAAATAPV